ncbi:MAG: hypothetical protein RL071_1397, partial [Pseudomonadota bacterium]
MLLWAMRGLTPKTSAVAGGARHFARARSSRISVGRYQTFDEPPAATRPAARPFAAHPFLAQSRPN